MIFTLSFINKYIFGIGVPVLLLALGVFYCVRLRFFYFLHPIRIIKELFSKEKGGGVSSLKALTLALAGTLGVGNMVGVASAIALGGFGAVFWMWVSALVAMVLKYAEIVLAMKYRRFDADGKPYGAAMYYIRACFKNGGFGRALAAVFALFCSFNAISMGSIIQVNSVASASKGVFNIPPLAVGLAFGLIALFALCKGTNGVLSLTDKIVPIMTVGFVVLSLAVIFLNPEDAAEAVLLIFKDAFSIRSASGGVLGFLLSGALRYGTMRGILSNEAGCGTAPTAHAVSDCKSPARQGVWGIFEVFVDTILLCALTAVVIIIGYDGELAEKGNYMMMTVKAYSSSLGSLAGAFIALSVILFGLATVLCWGYYGLQSVHYLSKRKWAGAFFIALYTGSLVLGPFMTGELIWELADLAIGAMSLINLSVLFLMSSEVRSETLTYFKRKGKF